jgi:cytochrome c oxidase subunit 1
MPVRPANSICATAPMLNNIAVAKMILPPHTVASFDWQLGNSYFVVAHFHYVILGVIVFAVFAATYY